MYLYDILKLKFPNANFISDIILQDDGDGPYIKQWNVVDVPQPTEKELSQWETELQDQYELQQVLQARQAAYPPKEDLIVALWERIVEGRTDATVELQAEREAVKSEYPKPGEE